MAAMYELYKPSNGLYSTMIIVDVVVAEIWMFFPAIGSWSIKKIDNYFRADATLLIF